MDGSAQRQIDKLERRIAYLEQQTNMGHERPANIGVAPQVRLAQTARFNGGSYPDDTTDAYYPIRFVTANFAGVDPPTFQKRQTYGTYYACILRNELETVDYTNQLAYLPEGSKVWVVLQDSQWWILSIHNPVGYGELEFTYGGTFPGSPVNQWISSNCIYLNTHIAGDNTGLYVEIGGIWLITLTAFVDATGGALREITILANPHKIKWNNGSQTCSVTILQRLSAGDKISVTQTSIGGEIVAMNLCATRISNAHKLS
jgi:hypothetical protein